MRRIAALLLLPTLLGLTARPVGAQRALSPGQWREDLRFLADSLPAKHREPFARVSREAFQRAVAELHTRIPTLADHEVVVGMARIVAMLHDGHTRLALPQDPAIAWSRSHTPTPPPADSSLFLGHLPVRLDLFEEGLFVRAASPEHEDLIGARVLEVGALLADSAIERVRPVVHYDNEMGFRFLAPAYLVVPEVLHAQGVAPTPERVRLVVEDRHGRRREVTLSPVPLFRAPGLVEAREIGPGPVPLSERDRDAKYWMEFLPKERALYVQLNEITNREDEPLRAFAARVERLVADSSVERVILDLRYNPGGSNSLARPLLLALVRSDRINRFGRLYTLIGRETFSAAQMFTNGLESLSNTLFVGEPSGSSPTHYGDSRRFVLPNSGLTVRASTIYWRDSSGDESRPWTPPHLPVARTAADYFGGRDPAVEIALRFEAGDPTDVAAEVAFRGGEMRGVDVLGRLLGDPAYAQVDLERAMLATGRKLSEAQRAEHAALWATMTTRMYPRSAQAHYARARALREAGRTDEALRAVEAALKLNPHHAEARQLRRTLAH